MKLIRALKLLPKNAVYDEMDSPIEKLTIIASPQGLHAILWDIDRDYSEYENILSQIKKSKNETLISQTKKQLNEYFQGKRKQFDLPLVLNGTDFQMKAWRQLQKIPYGKVITYGEQATKIGNKNKARPIGVANGSNPIPIVIPCHRVIGSNGHLVGFGGGVDKKAYLLQLEQNKTAKKKQ